MTLTLDKVAARCRAAPANIDAARDAEHWIRTSFEAALRDHLGPSLDRLAGTHVIRRLDVRVRLNAGQWSENRLLNELCRAFSEALFRALAMPVSTTNANRVHFADPLSWKAEMLRWLNGNELAEAWRFDLPPEVAGFDLRLSTLLLLVEEPSTLALLLRRLQAMGTLAHLASRWDDMEIERIFRAVSEHDSLPHAAIVDGEDAIFLLTNALATAPPGGKGFASRHHALLVYAARPESCVPPRDIFHLFTAARWMVEDPRALRSPRGWTDAATGVPALVLAWREALTALPSARWEPVAAKLAQHMPAVAIPHQKEASQLMSRNAGVFLLCRPVLDLNWHQALHEMEDRVFQAILALVFDRTTRKIAGPVDPERIDLDAAASLAAGLGAEPSPRDLRTLLLQIDVARLASLWHLEEAIDRKEATDLEGLIAEASQQLLLALGARLRGFRHAGAETIARSFVRVPGRLEVSDQRIRVLIDSMPFSIALRLSGSDGEQPRLPWLPGVEVDLRLEGL